MSERGWGAVWSVADVAAVRLRAVMAAVRSVNGVAAVRSVVGVVAVAWSISGAAVAAQDKVIADFRRPSLRPDVQLLRAERDTIDAAGGGTSAFTVLGRLGGSFTAAGARQTVYLVQPLGQAGASSKAPPMLRTGLGRDASTWPLPDEPHPDALEKVVDVDGDGMHEIVVRSDSFQMGVSSVRIGVVSLVGAHARVLLPLTDIYTDTCASPHGTRQIMARRLRWRADAGPHDPWVFETFTLDCPRVASTTEEAQAPTRGARSSSERPRSKVRSPL